MAPPGVLGEHPVAVDGPGGFFEVGLDPFMARAAAVTELKDIRSVERKRSSREICFGDPFLIPSLGDSSVL